VVSSAFATSPPPRDIPRVVLSLADYENSERWYSVVPNDSPVLLPVKQQASNGIWNDLSGVQRSSARLRVDGDPDGALTGFGRRNGLGWIWTWTPAVREPGKTYAAHLEAGPALYDPTTINVAYGESTFEFSYVDASSAVFLPTVELAVVDYRPSYALASAKCCEVVASECGNAPSCFQCWEREGRMSVGAEWDGPGIPYLTLSLVPHLDNLAYGSGSDLFLAKENREYCIEGTAKAAGEATTLTACGSPPVPPVDDVTGVQPVFAESCAVLPAGAEPLTILVAERAETEAQARELLEQQHVRSTPSDAPLESSYAPRCAISARSPAHSGAGATFSSLSLALLVTSILRRRRIRLGR
jgi:hypothetical protein